MSKQLVIKAPPAQAAKPAILNNGDMVNGLYKVTMLLGQGGFGAVFKVSDDKKKEIYALKVELKKPKVDEPGLKLEVGVLKRMQKNSHFVRYIDSGAFGAKKEHSFLVMQLVGKNLADLRKNCQNLRFTLSTSFRLCLQGLEAIQALHEAGLLHRDVKPANFAMGATPKDNRNVFMLDFGLVRRFKLSNGKIRNARPSAGFRGTVKYASVNVHNNLEQGRHDDLWSFMFMLIEFLKGELPWRIEPDRKKVAEMKVKRKSDFLSQLPEGIPKMYDSITALKYLDDPDYASYQKTLTGILKKQRVSDSDPFDWEEGGISFGAEKGVCEQPKKQIDSNLKVIKKEEKEPEKEKSDTDVSSETDRA